ncbi:hypothetical protein [Actinomyces sp. 187325]|uniref:hypothetical protein n=1 Tax=Actinomyces sp. 187325 TaxID=2927828 RepID=UPI002017A8D9|nr:hypothetical protein [Actinomyces sp. 187325]
MSRPLPVVLGWGHDPVARLARGGDRDPGPHVLGVDRSPAGGDVDRPADRLRGLPGGLEVGVRLVVEGRVGVHEVGDAAAVGRHDVGHAPGQVRLGQRGAGQDLEAGAVARARAQRRDGEGQDHHRDRRGQERGGQSVRQEGSHGVAQPAARGQAAGCDEAQQEGGDEPRAAQRVGGQGVQARLDGDLGVGDE